MWEWTAKISICLVLVLAFQTFSKSRQISALENEKSLVRYQAEQMSQRLSDADAAVKAADAARAQAYEETRRLLDAEPYWRDGAVAPALKDAIGGCRDVPFSRYSLHGGAVGVRHRSSRSRAFVRAGFAADLPRRPCEAER